MKKPKKRTLALAAVAVVVVGGTGTWWLTRSSSNAATTTTTYTVSASTIQQTVSASGTVEPAQSANLSFAVSGTVTHVYVTAGQKVSVGTPLASVDDTALISQRTAAAASVTAAEEQLSTDSSSGASSIQIASDQSNVASAQAAYANAVDAVNESVLTSTISGTVDAVNLAVGDVVSGGSGGSTGSSSSSSRSSTGSSTGSNSSTSSSGSFTVVSTGSYVVDATVAAGDVASVRKGMQVQLTVSGHATTVFGTVDSVGLVAQTDSSGGAVFPVTINVTGNPTGLYAGTSATASIIVKQVANAIAVPTRAIQTSGSQAYVMKVVGGKAVKADVVLGQVAGPLTEVTSGIKAGDVVQIPGFTRSGTGGGTRTGPGGGGFGGGGFGSGAGFGGGGGFTGGGTFVQGGNG